MTLYLGGYDQFSGGFREIPPEVIQPNEIVLYRVVSDGFMTGCTSCEVGYSADPSNRGRKDDCEYVWYTSRPFVGR